MIYPEKQEAAIIKRILSPEIADDPYAFVRLVFPWGVAGGPLAEFKDVRAWQREVLEDIARHIKGQRESLAAAAPLEVLHMATAAGRGIGKSALEVMLLYWLLSTRIGSTVLVSANTEDQLKKSTWGELANWHAMALNSHWFDLQATTLTPARWFCDEIKKIPKLANRIGPKYMATHKLWAEENPNGYAGPHNPMGMMVLFEEADGIPGVIWRIAEGYFTEPTVDRYFLAFSNPRSNGSEFYECFHANKKMWRTRQIDARTVEGTDPKTYERIIERYGADSDEAKVEVYGQFPDSSSRQFIPNSLVAEARVRELLPDMGAPLIMGVDVARQGADETVIRFRQGPDGRSIPPVVYKVPDLYVSAKRIAAAIDEYRPDAVCIDEGMGVGIVDILKGLGYKSHAVPFGNALGVDPHWANKGTEMYAAVREWLRVGGCIDGSEELAQDLTGRYFDFAGAGRDKIILEPKVEFKKRHKRSPDHGDAFALTFAVKAARRDLRVSRGSRNGRVAEGMDYDLFA